MTKVPRTVKRPTWKDANSEKNVICPIQRKENKRIKKFLCKNGWNMWDFYNSWEDGYTVSCRKMFSRISERNPYLHFSWYWDNRGTDDFWMARVQGFYNYKPEYKYMYPGLNVEIDYITKRELELLPIMENRLVSSLSSQSRLE